MKIFSVKGNFLHEQVLSRQQYYLAFTCVLLCVTGYFEDMDNITVNARCNLTIDHHEETTNVIESLDIKTFGSVTVFTEEDALTTLQGTDLTVRSGARVRHVIKSKSYIYSLRLLTYQTCIPDET